MTNYELLEEIKRIQHQNKELIKEIRKQNHLLDKLYRHKSEHVYTREKGPNISEDGTLCIQFHWKQAVKINRIRVDWIGDNADDDAPLCTHFIPKINTGGLRDEWENIL